MKILALLIGDRETGSTKYRLIQYVDWLTRRGIAFTFLHRDEVCRKTVADVAGYDLLFNQKCLFDSSLARALRRSARRVVFDIDDAIYTRPGRPYSWLTGLRVRMRLNGWLRQSHVVIAANHVLGDYCKRQGASVSVLQNAVDLGAWRPAEAPPAPGRDAFNIGWAGAPGNVPYLESLDPVFREVLRRHPRVRILVYSGRKPQLSVPFQHVPFQPGTEAGVTRQLAVGLLPLADEEYARGKSSIKAIQYLACGVPVVGHFVGAVQEICRPDCSLQARSPQEWVEAIGRYVENPELVRQHGTCARRHAEESHDFERNAQRLEGLLRQAPGTS